MNAHTTDPEARSPKKLKYNEAQSFVYAESCFLLNSDPGCQHHGNTVESFPYNPIKLGEFSLTKERQFANEATIPTVKDDVKLPINLNKGFEDWSDPSEIPTLNVLFKWICDNNFFTSNVNLLTYRGLLKKIAMTKYDVYKNHWCVRLSKLYSTVIMDEIETEEQKRKRQSESKQQKRFQYYGHKFEKEILHFDNEPKESNIVVTSKIGQHRCLFAAEIDGKDKIGNLVEIKTHRTMLTDHHKQAFKRSKLLNTYLQCYIAGISQTCFGFRDQRGYITQIRNYSLNEIEERCLKDWNKDIIMEFLCKILKWALDQIENGKVYHLQYSGDDHIKLQQVENVDYLPDWFIDHTRRCHENEELNL